MNSFRRDSWLKLVSPWPELWRLLRAWKPLIKMQRSFIHLVAPECRQKSFIFLENLRRSAIAVVVIITRKIVRLVRQIATSLVNVGILHPCASQVTLVIPDRHRLSPHMAQAIGGRSLRHDNLLAQSGWKLILQFLPRNFPVCSV